MAANEIHLNDIGTVFEITIQDGTSAIDVSGATTKQIIFQPPTGAKKTKTALNKTDGTDGIIKYTTVADDLDATGLWKYQAYVVLSGGTWSSSVLEFRVYPNL